MHIFFRIFNLKVLFSLSEESVTYLEHLSSEVIYEIFKFLDLFHIYQSFFHLNARFQKLLTYSYLPIKINISSRVMWGNLDQ
jgi:hypothetical protein